MTTDIAPPVHAAALDIVEGMLRLGARSPDEVCIDLTDSADRAAAQRIAEAVVANLPLLDAEIARTLRAPLWGDAASPLVTDCLRVGLAEMMFLDVPGNVAVNAMARLVGDEHGYGSCRGVVTAVLRAWECGRPRP